MKQQIAHIALVVRDYDEGMRAEGTVFVRKPVTERYDTWPLLKTYTAIFGV